MSIGIWSLFRENVLSRRGFLGDGGGGELGGDDGFGTYTCPRRVRLRVNSTSSMSSFRPFTLLFSTFSHVKIDSVNIEAADGVKIDAAGD